MVGRCRDPVPEACDILAMSEASKREGSTGTFEPRPEPAPTPWDELTQEQRHAASQAFGLVAALAAEKQPASKPWGDHLAQLQHRRKNHVILLDGDRGSGKTTVLVSLLYAWGVQRALATDTDVTVTDGFQALVDQARAGHVVPLRILDLRPFPDSRELILSIAGRLERVIRMLEESRRPERVEQTAATD